MAFGLGVAVQQHGGRVQQQRVLLDGLPADSQHAAECRGGRSMIDIGGVHGRDVVCGDAVDDGGEQCLP